MLQKCIIIEKAFAGSRIDFEQRQQETTTFIVWWEAKRGKLIAERIQADELPPTPELLFICLEPTYGSRLYESLVWCVWAWGGARAFQARETSVGNL